MPTKYLLREDQMPRHWYNILADLDSPPAPVLHPQTRKPSVRRTSRRSFPWPSSSRR